eukprot:1293231-Rhodomonas_salina.2
MSGAVWRRVAQIAYVNEVSKQPLVMTVFSSSSAVIERVPRPPFPPIHACARTHPLACSDSACCVR